MYDHYKVHRSIILVKLTVSTKAVRNFHILHIFFSISNSIFWVNVRVAQQIYVFKVKSSQKLLSNFQNFNFKKFVLNTGSLQLVYIFRMQRKLFIGIDSNFHSKFTFKICITNHVDRPGIKTTLCKINKIFYCYQYLP